MKLKFSILSYFSFLLFANSVKAQTCDPWIQQIYKQVFQRSATAEECNIRNYNNGSWKNYDELVGYIKAYKAKSTTSMPELKGDPWIFQAYQELYNRRPNAWELNVNNYNGGAWGNYAELKNHVAEFQNAIRNQKLEIKTAPYNNNNVLVGFFINNQQVAVNVVAAGGGNVVAAGGANVVSAGGANVVSAGGANIVAAGGGNILVNTGMAGVNFGGRYVTQSVGTKVIPISGKGALIIR